MEEKAWYIGNTTVRNAKRLKDGLSVLYYSSLHGNLEGKKNEQEFAKLLHSEGIVNIRRLNESPDNDASDVGRKWRAAFVQLGFLTPRSTILKKAKAKHKAYTITP